MDLLLRSLKWAVALLLIILISNALIKIGFWALSGLAIAGLVATANRKNWISNRGDTNQKTV